MSLFTRREFLKISALSACSLYISTTFTGCGDDTDEGCDCVDVAFDHGVASGDPLSDRVILWTRATPLGDFDENKDVKVDLEVAEDEAFTNIIRKEKISTSKDHDYTLKVDLQDLKPAKVYYYRFRGKNPVSDTGRTKTLPIGNVSQVKMALFTCANYPYGYFNAYSKAAKIEDLDVAVHVGDYIYEYGMFESDGKTPAYATQKAQRIGRVLPSDNDKECVNLDDYRKRYALYHTDKGTQAIHKAVPMIVVWDDHEIANDSYKDGAANQNPEDGVSWEQRVRDGLQAYFEWLPIRPVSDKKKIFRSFDFGNLVSLHMLETRLFARSKQLNYGNYFKSDGSFDKAKFVQDLSSDKRTMLGSQQLQWLQGKMKNSQSTWQVLGQQVLMGRMSLPAEIIMLVGQLDVIPDSQKPALMQKINTSLSELAVLKVKKLKGGTLTDVEEARLSTVMPYNLDAWDGYPYEREVVFESAKMMDKNLVVFAGDTHNAWANDLKDKDGNQIGVEFATTSVTSPGFEDYLSLPNQESAKSFEQAVTLLIDDLKYFNSYDRGFLTVTFTPDEAVCEWFYVDNYDSHIYGMQQNRYKKLKVKKGKEARKIE